MKNKVITIIFVFIFLVLVIPVGIKLFFDISAPVIEKEISTIDYYGYSLKTNHSQIYKDIYKELDKVLSNDIVDYNAYASLISKLFVIDVFTLDNKLASTDVGGTEFIHPDLKENFIENMGANMYNHVLSNLDGSRTQNLPIVKSVNVNSVSESNFEYNDNNYEGFLVDCSFDYEVDLGYQTKILLTIIKDNNILYVVKGE